MAMPDAPAVDITATPPAPVFVREEPPPVPDPGVTVAVGSARPEPPVRITGQSVRLSAGSKAIWDEARSVGQTKVKKVIEWQLVSVNCQCNLGEYDM